MLIDLTLKFIGRWWKWWRRKVSDRVLECICLVGRYDNGYSFVVWIYCGYNRGMYVYEVSYCIYFIDLCLYFIVIEFLVDILILSNRSFLVFGGFLLVFLVLFCY